MALLFQRENLENRVFSFGFSIKYYFFISLGDSFSQFRFVEEKEWDGEVSGPKQVRWFVLNVDWLFSRLKTFMVEERCAVVLSFLAWWPGELARPLMGQREGKLTLNILS